MIGSHEYLCGSAEAAVLVTHACLQAGCEAYAFFCGRAHCDCSTLHRRHQQVLLNDLLEDALKSGPQPELLVQRQKQITAFFDTLMKNLEQCRDKHQLHFQQFAEQALKGGRLRRKLAQRLPLDLNQATGETLRKMVEEMDNPSSTDSPYSQTSKELEASLAETQRDIGEVLNRLERLWETQAPIINPAMKQKFAFSSTLKHKDMRVDGSFATSQKHSSALVLLQPAIPTDASSRISFRIQQFQEGRSSIRIGTCYLRTAELHDFLLDDGDDNWFGLGVYILDWNGIINSHSHSEEKEVRISAMGFGRKGAIVEVEFNHATSRLIYTIDGVQVGQQRTSISLTTKYEVHFVVYLRNASVMII